MYERHCEKCLARVSVQVVIVTDPDFRDVQSVPALTD